MFQEMMNNTRIRDGGDRRSAGRGKHRNRKKTGDETGCGDGAEGGCVNSAL